MELTFVVGTGRCGSTMLSRLLRDHPDVLSMSEFFSTLRIAAASGRAGFPVEEMDGAQLWRLLASPFPMLDAMISDGLRTPEMLYPAGGRFDPATGIPLVSHYILPMLGGDPDRLFDELAAEVPRWPRRPAAAQYQHLFGYLARRLGRPVVVERSASSLHMIPLLHAQFPAARFVHLYRDGPDCALSMSRHPAFRREILAIGAVRAVKLPADSTLQQVNDALPERFRGLVCPPYDARKLSDFPIPVEVFGRDRWSPMICAGVAALGQVPEAARASLRYEDLLADPVASLAGLAEFIGIGAPDSWLDLARRSVDPARTGTAAAELGAGALARLRAACEPGTRALAAAGLVPSGVRVAHRPLGPCLSGLGRLSFPLGGEPGEQGDDGGLLGRAGQRAQGPQLVVGEPQELAGQVGDGSFAVPQARLGGGRLVDQRPHQRLAVAVRAAVAVGEAGQFRYDVVDAEHPAVQRLGQEAAGLAGLGAIGQQVGERPQRRGDRKPVRPGHLVRRERAHAQLHHVVPAGPPPRDGELHVPDHEIAELQQYRRRTV